MAIDMVKAPSWYGSEGGFGRQLVTKTAEFSDGAGTGQAGTFALFTVTGDVIARVVAVCTDTLVEGVGGGTIEVGVTGSTAVIIAQTTATDIDVTDIWHAAVPATDIAALTVMSDHIIAAGLDIFATIGAQTITDGTIAFYCFWTPLSSDGNIVAA